MMPLGIRYLDLVNLVDFIYTGEIKIPNEGKHLGQFYTVEIQTPVSKSAR